MVGSVRSTSAYETAAEVGLEVGLDIRSLAVADGRLRRRLP